MDHNPRATTRSAEAADIFCVDPAIATERLRTVPWRRLAILGDSVTAGVHEPTPGYEDRSFSDRLVDALAETHPGFESVNLARPGLEIAQIRHEQLLPALVFEPDAVLVSAGANDAFHASFHPSVLEAELEGLLGPFAERGISIVTIGLFDLARSGLVPEQHVSSMARRWDELDRVTSRVCRRLGGVHADGHHHPLASDPSIFSSDRIHANARGHAVAFATIVDAVTGA
ncbi:MAG: SGNH/GDSL hydrolase family protein [Microbacterium sp.]